MTKDQQTGQGGFTLIEVSIASLIVLVGLVALAGLFTLSISQNKIVKQYTSTTAFAQEKIEQLTALEQGDVRLVVGGSLTAPVTVTTGGTPATILYSDDIYVSDNAADSDVGTVYMTSSGPAIPGGNVNAQYRRYWSVQLVPTPSLPTATLANSVLIGVRVVALQAGRNTGKAEETTLTIVRSW